MPAPPHDLVDPTPDAASHDDAIPETAVHPRVLPLSCDSGYAHLFVVWRDPGGARALHGALRPLVEASLLMDLCRVGETRRSGVFSGLRVALFEPVAGCDEALAAFGLTRAPADAPRHDDERPAVAHARGEASALGREVPDACWAFYAAEARSTPTALALEEALAPQGSTSVFGERPGALFGALETMRRERGLAPLEAGAEALDTLERELVADACGVLRWIPPACFLALCDAIAVIAAREGREVAWAECEADAEGIAPPPMIRVTTSDGHAHVPLGLEVLRWCVMPRRPGEVVPPLRAWLHDRL